MVEKKSGVQRELSVDERLAVNKFTTDDVLFIEVNTELCKSCELKPCLYVCPAQVYTLESGNLVYNPEGCIELGACKVVCQEFGNNAIKWNYPRGGYGIRFRYG